LLRRAPKWTIIFLKKIMGLVLLQVLMLADHASAVRRTVFLLLLFCLFLRLFVLPLFLLLDLLRTVLLLLLMKWICVRGRKCFAPRVSAHPRAYSASLATLSDVIFSVSQLMELLEEKNKQLRLAVNRGDQLSAQLASTKKTSDDVSAELKRSYELKEKELVAVNAQNEALKAERDKLVQEKSMIASSEDALKEKVRLLSKDVERLEVLSPPCLL